MRDESSDLPIGFMMTLEVAEEFFNRCIMKEAITKEERLQVLKELVKEKQAKELNNAEFNDVLLNKKILVVKKNEKSKD